MGVGFGLAEGGRWLRMGMDEIDKLGLEEGYGEADLAAEEEEVEWLVGELEVEIEQFTSLKMVSMGIAYPSLSLSLTLISQVT